MTLTSLPIQQTSVYNGFAHGLSSRGRLGDPTREGRTTWRWEYEMPLRTTQLFFEPYNDI